MAFVFCLVMVYINKSLDKRSESDVGWRACIGSTHLLSETLVMNIP